jgi:hypothetical protein
MWAGLGLSYTAAGWMNMSTALGTCGALLDGATIKHSGAFSAMVARTLACAVALGRCAGFDEL